MNKDLFIQSLRDYNTISKDVATDILELKSDYPYCQLLHALAAKVSKDHNLASQTEELQMAAVYAADRAVLKEVITGQIQAAEVSRALIHSAEIQDVPKADATISASNEDLAEEVIHDLERLHQLRHNFELLFTDQAAQREEKPIDDKAPIIQSTSELPPIKVTAEAEHHPVEKTEKQPRDLKARKERIVAIARALQAQEAEDEANGLKKKKSESGEGLIDEIVSTKEELTPENDKQKEQLNIIEQFIKTQPSISPNKDKTIAAPSGDLATIKTGEFGDHVVSETLAEILVKQGKKEKAIEVYKKLIWKFPQKKTYFAAQIEELKK